MKTRPSVSVIIPTLNDRAALRATLETLGPFTEEVEVIVVDGTSGLGPTEPTGARGQVNYLHSPPGRGLQMARGACAASGDTLLFLHADTRLEPGWRSAMERALADPRVVGGAFRFVLDGDRFAYRIIEWGARWRVRLFHLPYGDQGLFVRREAYEAVGGMPPVSFMEDVEFVGRLKRLGRLATADGLARTSPRRYERVGVVRGVIENWIAALLYFAGVDGRLIERWYHRSG